MEDIKTDGLLNMEQASNFLNVKMSTLYAMTMRKQIRVVKIGKLNRFRRIDLERFVNERITIGEGSCTGCVGI